ncbi:MAG: ABC transporter ATP-binding protein [Oscillospiraceae bacterium]|nr:ABC transporter ATP-binding protein [Oscillospiraceae bacterium]
MSEIVIRCTDLIKMYGNVAALKGINLELEKGKIIGLLGPNGSGKTTLIKLICGLLTPTSGDVEVMDMKIGVETKKIVSYLPDRNYIPEKMTVSQAVNLFADFYEDFDRLKAERMFAELGIQSNLVFKNMSKGTREKAQLVLVMSRNAQVYILDEPIAGVDPAAREFILNTIISNYNPESTLIISTHLIADIENVLEDIIFIKDGNIEMHKSVDEIREENGMSVDETFREVFRC